MNIMPPLWLYYYKYTRFVQVINRSSRADDGVKSFDKTGAYADNSSFNGRMMIKARLRTTLSCSPKEAFRHFENVAALVALKKELLGARIARSEPGLEIVDAVLRLPFFMRMSARLKYTTVPETFAELKQIKGPLPEYRWAFSFSEIGGNARIEVEAVIRLPLGPIGFMLGLIISPGIKRKMRRELITLEKLTASL